MKQKLSGIHYRQILTVLFMIATLLLIAPIIGGAAYTYPCNDDFSFEGGALDGIRFAGGSSLRGAIDRTIMYYNGHQGTFLFNFLIHYILPYTRWGLPGFHLVMILLDLGLFCSLFFAVRELFKDKAEAAVVLFAATFLILGGVQSLCEMEMFYWFTGAINYTLPLTLFFIAFTLYVRIMRNADTKISIPLLVADSLIAFLGSGCILIFAIANVAWLTAVCIFGRARIPQKKILLLPPAAALAGALVNIVAPGNYIRSGEGLRPGHSTVLDAIRDAFGCWAGKTASDLTSVSLWVVLLLTFSLCLFLRIKILPGKMTVPDLTFALTGMLLTQLLATFCITYGDHLETFDSLRTESACQIIYRLMHLFAVIFIAQFIGERLPDRKPLPGIAGMIPLVACIVLILCTGSSFKENLKYSISYATALDLKTGTLQRAYITRQYVLSACALTKPGEDAVVYAWMDAYPTSAYGMGLSDSPEEFVNVSAASVFGVKSVTVFYLSPEDE